MFVSNTGRLGWPLLPPFQRQDAARKVLQAQTYPRSIAARQKGVNLPPPAVSAPVDAGYRCQGVNTLNTPKIHVWINKGRVKEMNQTFVCRCLLQAKTAFLHLNCHFKVLVLTVFKMTEGEGRLLTSKMSDTGVCLHCLCCRPCLCGQDPPPHTHTKAPPACQSMPRKRDTPCYRC